MHLLVLLACGSEAPVSEPAPPPASPPLGVISDPGEPKEDPASPLPTASSGPGDVPPGVLPIPTRTRADIAEGDHVVLRGTVDSACDGAVRVDLVPAEPGNPIAVLQLPDGATSWEVLAPKDADVVLTAICDIDRDGRLSPDDWLAELLPVGRAEADQEGLELHWMPNMDPGAMALGKPDVVPEQPRVPIDQPPPEPPPR